MNSRIRTAEEKTTQDAINQTSTPSPAPMITMKVTPKREPTSAKLSATTIVSRA